MQTTCFGCLPLASTWARAISSVRSAERSGILFLAPTASAERRWQSSADNVMRGCAWLRAAAAFSVYELGLNPLRITGALPDSIWIKEPNECQPQRQYDQCASQQHNGAPVTRRLTNYTVRCAAENRTTTSPTLERMWEALARTASSCPGYSPACKGPALKTLIRVLAIIPSR